MVICLSFDNEDEVDPDVNEPDDSSTDDDSEPSDDSGA